MGSLLLREPSAIQMTSMPSPRLTSASGLNVVVLVPLI